ncbi:hypothetical protein L596_013295 [Steinernema carpocapsae]|uniref:DAN domain-containing protein n=1 Tax=Steinernema carpocapsae TaxID=34508 RepID=A0A4U5P0D4_STECR|nr:hypothetical protein L596_013295 [Steinernema carpocapsae]
MAQTTLRSQDYVSALLYFVVVCSVATGATAATLAKGGCKLIGHTHVIDELGCDLVAVKVNRCSGYCWSFSFPNPKMDNQLTVHAKCCRMLETEMVLQGLANNRG